MNRFEIVTPIIIHYEGFESKAYYDSTGKVWTIGNGFTRWEDGTPVKEGDIITLDQNNILLQNEIKNEFFPQINSNIKVDLEEYQWATIIDYTYSRGIGNVIKSGIFDLINKNSLDPNITNIIRKTGLGGGLKGLIARRNTESNLYLTGETKFYN
jgi:lysozyme